MRESLWTKNFILLSLSNLFLFMAIEMLLPTLPIFAADQGSTESQIGLILGFFTFAAVLSRPLTGAGMKRLGKKGLLLVGVIICLIGMASYYVAGTLSVLLLLRVVHGIGFGLATTMFGTVVSDVIPASRRGEGMGFFATGNAISFSLGPFLGIWLLDHYSYGGLFGFGVVILLLSLFFTLFVRLSPEGQAQIKAAAKEREAEAAIRETAAAREVSWVHGVVERKALFPSVLGMMVGFAFGGLLSFITLFGIEKGLANIGYFFLVVAISEVLIRFVSGPLFDRKGRFWVLFPSAILCVIGCVLLYKTETTAMLLLAAVFYGLGFGALFPALQAWVINRVEPERRGVATATYYNLFDIGIGSGAILLGFAAMWTNYATMFLFSGLFFVVYLVLYLVYERKHGIRGREQSKQAA
ncbi:MFS transporter [Paenibacillus gorillae]|uniref:MFS transporter n=1 Tax=Paenibacillus gorillae TaxID=1243662 RepID=UPI0004B43D74|nr:MFS transporter [Paenibacillus gorillae]